jgi:hypothetical protein
VKKLPNLALILALFATATAPVAVAAEGVMESVRDFLTVSAFDGAFRVRLSGTLDLEGYHLPQPPPGLLFTDRHNLFNPRLTLFLDSQVGDHLYAFVQARVDRGFDPTDGGSEIRADEYALRYTPWNDGRLSIQAGKFATVAGNWVQRHLSWDNAFITAPVPYENLTAVWDGLAPEDGETLLYWAHVPYEGTNTYTASYADKAVRLPIIWGPSYATGASVAGRLGKFEYAAEVKNASLSSRPKSWDVSEVNFDYPTFTARLGYRPNQMWNLGFSASRGAYLLARAEDSLPPDRGIGDYHQQVLAQDISFEWHHLQIWAEVFETRFEVPTVGHADTLAYYVEAKYKITPQLFGALRWNQQLFGTIPDEEQGGRTQWGNDLWRADAALGYRFTTATQVKLQYSLLHEDNAPHAVSSLLAAQFTLRF